MKVWIVRHGESETNLAGLWTGWLDVQLTDKGREDAAKAGKLLAGTAFDKIYASDLARARSTAEIAVPGRQYETSPMLREVNVGNIAGKPLSMLTDEQRQDAAQHGYVQFEGESSEEFEQRVFDFLRGLERSGHENVALFAHAGWLRRALKFAVGVALPNKHVCCNNCTVAVLEYTGELWRLHSWINLD
ncbi:MAG: histidine phosphatase family protein [Ruminococcaceae bacterium]|nr:histidine phosphatase family protein [Oscillospiraceae bacterium]